MSLKTRTVSRHTQSAAQVPKQGGMARGGKVTRCKSASLPSSVKNYDGQDTEERSESEESNMSHGSSSSNKNPSKVYCLEFHGKNLSSFEMIKKFPNCKTADFSCNHIKKMESLDKNPEIHELKLYSNELTSIEGLGRLRRLQNLQLQHNKIRTIGDGLKGLRSLKFLNLASNRLATISAQELTHCSNITFLDLSNNNINRMEFLSAIPYIEELYLSGNQLSQCPDASCCKKLQEIDLSSNRLTDLNGIKALPNLSVVKISNNLLGDLTSLGNSRSVQRIDASRNKISRLSHISGQFPNLEVLDLAHNSIFVWEEIVHLKQLKELIELYLEGNKVKEDIERSGHITWSHKVQEILPRLEILDGHHLGNIHLKSGERHIMRPMTASAGLSTKMVKDQINLMNSELSMYESMITSRFVAMNSLLDSLRSNSITETDDTRPSEPGASSKRRIQEEEIERPSTSSSNARPASRCGSRARIQAALEFASHETEK
ncbi:protein phosphatase 1 regulatory subunit 7-like isoform X1 [Rhopilema esculentum]|uniref:protein phosphatase 1 regulatory subunit 7-like isoform X1 n=1 Tax=Rhopilema esculentum TaxID=499914 RepID=UPI0031D3E138